MIILINSLICFLILAYVVAQFFRLPNAQLKEKNLDVLQSVSIIIPARNEAHNIKRLLNSIAQQSESVKEVIVVNDASTDDTAQIAKALGAKVIDVKKPDSSWTGKTYACYMGAKAAQGQYYLFIDADTWFDSQAFKKIESLADHKPAIVSLCPYHYVPKLHEQFSAFFNIMMVLGLNAFEPILGQSKQQKKLFGQCLFIDKEHYWSIDGHASVKQHILENVYMSQKLIDQGHRLFNLGGKNFINMQMFPNSLGELTMGWIKAFTSGASQTPTKTLITLIAFLSVCMFSAIMAFMLPLYSGTVLYTLCALYTCVAFYTYFLLRTLGSYYYLTAVLFPIPLFFFMTLFGLTPLIKKLGFKISWKGRSIA